RGWHKTLKKGETIRIMTGAPVPKRADAVQKVELTRESENRTVKILSDVKKGTAIVKKASEVTKGKVVIQKGERITDNLIAPIAAFGNTKVKVARQPRVAIIGTGSEIVEIHQKPGRDQIRNSNSVMLKALAESAGASVEIFPNSGDDISDLKSLISKASARADILVTTGGVSVGKYDLTKAALKELGAEIFFDRILLKPGKPTVFARLRKTLVFGLPGNPVSAAVTFHLFVRTTIRLMQGSSAPKAAKGFAVMKHAVRGSKDRDSYLPAILNSTKEARLEAETLKWGGSSDFIGYSRAECLVVIPRGRSFAAGDVVRIIRL
ncbi:MAG TPA: molybdopterin molybdotransferase MoeA, partial [Pyrinomonadaceae bacterium]|nr:molybdopterin molybdotransferase MoeA [Pyrinomonadaceae bacterium]